ncbi:TPA: hypothetical protein NKQ37_000883 [Vibrio parahaemolyticus]|uniref:hypothetical protein n=2 Tax=Vibrio parahaemolyticus TaxID=670 RepID=UPI0010D123D3|nr:hypothetical protein [Vibrio parahaemolyticus]EIU6819299.1 hypothetical protein [Vibrio parahaemolyticus]EIV1708279.1 hypothetical protein [Vibrio parahaemolyticus]MDF4936647.1 hypothetical protein [Vibrio parahaemolyticus]MDF5064058.1 hypothetical protein [Vibrio parahaemolyticus]MDF5332264.1 hypothetical protein [Vibrio parahaemolyticus]
MSLHKKFTIAALSLGMVSACSSVDRAMIFGGYIMSDKGYDNISSRIAFTESCYQHAYINETQHRLMYKYISDEMSVLAHEPERLKTLTIDKIEVFKNDYSINLKAECSDFKRYITQQKKEASYYANKSTQLQQENVEQLTDTLESIGQEAYKIGQSSMQMTSNTSIQVPKIGSQSKRDSLLMSTPELQNTMDNITNPANQLETRSPLLKTIYRDGFQTCVYTSGKTLSTTDLCPQHH